MKRDRGRKKEENSGECLSCCAFLARYISVFSRAVLSRECKFERKKNLLKRTTSSGKKLL